MHIISTILIVINILWKQTFENQLLLANYTDQRELFIIILSEMLVALLSPTSPLKFLPTTKQRKSKSCPLPIKQERTYPADLIIFAVFYRKVNWNSRAFNSQQRETALFKFCRVATLGSALTYY